MKFFLVLLIMMEILSFLQAKIILVKFGLQKIINLL